MIAFEVRLRSMLRGMVALRLRQLRYVLGEWAYVFGLKPSSGKWMERISFVYIYVLIVAVSTPAVLQVLGSLYESESKTSAALQAAILQNTIPWLVAIFSVLLIVNPWKAWMLRLTFGDISYLASSPFDRRVLALWRYLEMVVAIPLLFLFPLILVAPMFGSIWAEDVFQNILRAMLAIGLWAAPMLALGWHVSLQQYVHSPLPTGISLLARLGVIVAAGLLAATNPAVLLWPGRLIVLLAMGKAPWAWILLVGFALAGIGVVWRAASHLSMTRASAGSNVFARIQQLGYMVLVDRQLLFSILSDARAHEQRATGILPPARGSAIIFARAALHYRRRLGQAVQLFVAGMVMGLALIVWRPATIVPMVITAVLLALLMPPWLAYLFRRDMAVPFMSQFVPQPLTRRVLAASVTPVALVLAGMIPVLAVFGIWMPGWAWGIAPAIWVLSLAGHVEAVGKGSTPGDRNLFTVLLDSAAVLVVMWSTVTSGASGLWALGWGIIAASGVSLALLLFADFRHHGLVAE